MRPIPIAPNWVAELSMLESLSLQVDWEKPLPASVKKLVEAAARREDQFRTTRRRDTPPSFYSSNFGMVYGALTTMLDKAWVRQGDALLEWGSGLGAAACLWNLLGGNACGIESDAGLVEQANCLAAGLQLKAEFAEGNFLPNNAWSLLDPLDDATRLQSGGVDGYQRLGRKLEDFQIVFVYPWPGERRFIEDVFDTFAAPGAYLLCFYGGDELGLMRKTA